MRDIAAGHKIIEQPEQAPPWKQEYAKAAIAAELLYQNSLTNYDGEKGVKTFYEDTKSCDLLHNKSAKNETAVSEGEPQPVAMEEEIPKFFEALPILNKLAQIHQSFKNPSPLKTKLNYYTENFETRDLSIHAKETLYQSLSAIDERTIAQLDEHNTKDFFESIKVVLTHDFDAGIEWAVNFLDQYRDLFNQLSTQKQLPDIQNQFNQLQDFLKTREFERTVVNAIQIGTYARGEQDAATVEIKYCEKLLREIMSKYGLDPDRCLNAWRWYDPYNMAGTIFHPRLAIKNNMDAVFNLEDKRPGIAQLLHRQKEFGIANFGRYPEQILIAQFDECDNVERPYGIMIQAHNDWNNAFSDPEYKGCWAKLFEQTKEHYAFRVVEAGSVQEVVRKLIALNQKYGSHNKIAFNLTVAHGSKDSMTFSKRKKGGKLDKETLAKPGAERIGKFFEPHSIHILISCSTGRIDGIGQELSNILNACLMAPDNKSNLSSIEVIIEKTGIENKINLIVKYRNGEGSVITKTYSKGEEVK